MKVVRRLALRGNARYICVPRAMADFLRWDIGKPLVVEVIEGDALRVRSMDERDIRSALVPPMDLALPHGATK